MKYSRRNLSLACLTLVLFSSVSLLNAEQPLQYQEDIRPKLVTLCGDCHSPEDSEHDVKFLQATSVGEMSQMRSIWKSVAEQLRNRTMPPPDEIQPSETERLEISEWIDQTLQQTACEHGPYAGSITSRRLNRTEYTNTIQDLLGVETDAAVRFPVDGSGGEGFDNNGETLFLPPILMERYLEAADEILDAALPSQAIKITIPARELLPPEEKADSSSRVLEPKKSLRWVPRIYSAGQHFVRVRAQPVEKPTTLTLKVDGIVVERFTIDGQPKSAGDFPVNYDTNIQLSRGFHTLEIRCTGDEKALVSFLHLKQNEKELNKDQLHIYENLTGTSPDKTPENPRTVAERKLKAFISQAFRRPANSTEVDKYMSLYDRAAQRGDPHVEAIKLAMKGVLVSSPFIFRMESLPETASPQPVSNYELATRLSYFLWGSMPDEKLFQLAAEGRLNEDAVLVEQVDRMLNDPRADYFIDEFVGQWLGTHEVGARVAPDTSKFKGEFTTELLLGFREEPNQLFAYLLQENRSLMELITADYVIVNKRLRKHYGFDEEEKSDKQDWPWSPNPQLSKDGPFEKVMVTNGQRGGVLGMGGVHLLTSYPNRTSPVLRGGWILETLLGIRVPNPPPDIPELSKSKKGKMTIREQLALHRDHPSCSACHNLIDPPGFALDHYDVLGRWQEEQEGKPIDATATFPSGKTVEGLAGLKAIMMQRKPDFYRQLTRKMLGFALGRSLDDRDDCVINQISDDLLNNDDSLRNLITSVVLSTPFRNRQLSTEEASISTD
ncbi:DUF1592 domain-containing protein [Rubinisphaera sp.]|uniref:DUF1592 domain-containing protein n=1 Tax=Rubinisphaera sp. TaxID=2024857 RepID=UPI000C10C084|nr:DUF1592 domain-containing protein [Rubinisphaera sp.]MBV08181.1 hypothetical protein [Rubinisphaera sp.]